MFARLAEWLGLRHPLVRAARQPEAGDFARKFLDSHLYFLCLPPAFADGLDSRGVTPEQFVAYVEQAAADLASRQEFVPFDYELDGRRTVPIFTGQEHARVFVQDFVRSKHRILPFQVLGVTGEALLGRLGAFESIVLVRMGRPAPIASS